jgi:hypothetical protein
MTRLSSFIIHHSAFIIISLLAGCAGYQVGNQSLYPSHIHTVCVPMFESTSLRPYLGERLTEAVVKEIELKTPYKVVGNPDLADSVLSGRITGEAKHLVVANRYNLPRQVEVDLKVQVQWVDRQDNMIRRPGTVALPPELVTVSESALATPEVGQSISTAQLEAIHRLAQQIVGMMENQW